MGTPLELSEIKLGIYELVCDLKDEKQIQSLSTRTDIKALFIRSAKPGIVIAGADINEIKDLKNAEEAEQKAKTGQSALNAFAQLPFPTIAVIDGACLDSNLEWALACTYRIATDNPETKIGLPAVTVGLIPSLGGTQRLPRLIGIQAALPLILGGKTVNGLKAFKLKIVDALYPSAFLESKIIAFADFILTESGRQNVIRKRRLRGVKNYILEKTFSGQQLMFRAALNNVLKQTQGRYPAPIAALKVIRSTLNRSLQFGLAVEAKHFAQLITTDVFRNLVNLYFVSEDLKKDNDIVAKINLLPIQRSAILGTGVMGSSIAWLLSHHGIPVRMKDISLAALEKGYKSATQFYRHLTSRQAQLNLLKIGGTLTYNGFRNTQIVIEAVDENMTIKKAALAELENQVNPQTIIASNTAALSITEMGAVLNKADRFIGLHFFNPVNHVPLVEVIPGEKTADSTIATIVAFAKTLGKIPIVVGNCPGFLVNRILLPYRKERIYLLEENQDAVRVGQIIATFGMPMDLLKIKGPIRTNIQPFSEALIVQRCIYIMINEAAKCMEENIVRRPDYLDMAMILGIGFPAFRGGLLRYADQIGIAKVTETIQKFCDQFGDRFKPSTLLMRMAKKNQCFYQS